MSNFVKNNSLLLSRISSGGEIVTLSVSPNTILSQNNGVIYTLSGSGTAIDKLTTGGNTLGFGGGRFDDVEYRKLSWTCGVTGILYFEWGPGSYEDDGPYYGSLAAYTRNGIASSTFATAVLPGTEPIINERTKTQRHFCKFR